ncbi:MAG TPA: Kdo hydroxylase family protein [Candidatus Angelobacter sp.]|nr:Kdo hydroxylase family protein [Candidatus Angelobacter sp.]
MISFMATNLSPALVEVAGYAPEQARWYCEQLERGKVLFSRSAPFDFPRTDIEFLLSQKQTGSRFHKNVSYRPAADLLKGDDSSGPDRERLHAIMRNFSGQVTAFVTRFLAPYAGKFKLDYASYRPLEEQGRGLPLHKRNDLLHVDAFPTRPTKGARILRVFLNINPSAERVWNVGEPFHEFFPKVAGANRLDPPHRSPLGAAVAAVASKIGLPIPDRSRYDEYMLHLHNWLKENNDFQKNSPKFELKFPPGCFWMVYTDGVPHAVLSGRFALEQTFIIPALALVTPDAAPVRVLESATGVRMAP